ncbi:olfactory receptor 24-like [Tachyglossus aculeatus]|uniref:olfactory receptor 24-like n=1 Tax=Tachyglossus aculeatus TaxID=9261 RepID=UPI0018F32F57|nr:olfactory receptor 24-like [Tachyglossus aculeatus]
MFLRKIQQVLAIDWMSEQNERVRSQKLEWRVFHCCMFVSNEKVRRRFQLPVAPRPVRGFQFPCALVLGKNLAPVSSSTHVSAPKRGRGKVKDLATGHRPQGFSYISTAIWMFILISDNSYMSPMEGVNQTRDSEFVLLGLLGSPKQQQQQQQLIFWLFLWLYLLGGTGNLFMILATSSNPLLHTPMYFFLSNLSFIDLCLITTTVPKMLLNIQTRKQTISYAGCLTQMYFANILLGMDNLILGVMALDRNVAICHPLRYTSVMLPSLCALLVAVPWVLTNLISLALTLLTARLSFCGNNEIPHFFCDINMLLKLSCSDTRGEEIFLLILTSVFGMPPLVCILVSYSRIVATVLRIPSAKGKQKAFTTCGSHLTVVALFYGAGLAVFFTPPSSHSKGKDPAPSVMYMVVTPMLNPFIYSLRNKDMKGVVKKWAC